MKEIQDFMEDNGGAVLWNFERYMFWRQSSFHWEVWECDNPSGEVNNELDTHLISTTDINEALIELRNG